MELGFIGLGNMAKAIIAGWLASDAGLAAKIKVHSAHKSNYETYAKKWGLTACASNKEVAANSDFIFLAVKPFLLAEVLKEIKPALTENKVLVSMAAGVSLADIAAVVGPNVKLIRIMPNVNAEISMGMTALVANEKVSQAEYQKVEALMASEGEALAVAEKDFSIFSALAGCAPAYVYYFIDALSRAGVKHGLKKSEATKIATQTVLGSAQKVLSGSLSPMDMVDQVCSPGGTTVAGLLAMEEAGFMTAVVKGIDAAVAKDQGK